MKTLIWLVGKPGCGKTTVANILANLDGAKLFSYGKLLQQVKSDPGPGGFSNEDREKVNEIIASTAQINQTIIVDGNPYAKAGLEVLSLLKDQFDEIRIVHLCIADEIALARLEERCFPIKDDARQQARIDFFNRKLLPLIEAYGTQQRVYALNVEKISPSMVAAKIMS